MHKRILAVVMFCLTLAACGTDKQSVKEIVGKPVASAKKIVPKPLPKKHLIVEKKYDQPAYYVSWVDEDESPKIALLCIHGFGLSGLSFEKLGRKLAAAGVPTYAMDVRGFGLWAKHGQGTLDYEAALADVTLVAKEIRKKHPGIPLVLLGESMGGAVVVQAAAQAPQVCDGIISVVPGNKRFKSGRTRLKVAVKLMTDPNEPAGLGDDIVEMATTNEYFRQRWKDAPLVRLDLSPKELITFQKFMNKTEEAAEQITHLPVLVIQAKGDLLIRPESTFDIYQALGTPKADFYMVSNHEHLIFEEGLFSAGDVALLQAWMDNAVKSKHQI
ncbi:MAG: lysophospholipase [Candidatus Obscuribacterales bacterium]|nr:lysophospholipase [Candidatus Obscuribacterales bacterium]